VSAYVITVSQTIITDKLITFACILGENYYSFSVTRIFQNFLVGGGWWFQFQNGNSRWPSYMPVLNHNEYNQVPTLMYLIMVDKSCDISYYSWSCPLQ